MANLGTNNYIILSKTEEIYEKSISSPYKMVQGCARLLTNHSQLRECPLSLKQHCLINYSKQASSTYWLNATGYCHLLVSYKGKALAFFGQ